MKNKEKFNYQIFSLNDDGSENVLCRFYADNNVEANNYLVKNYIDTANGSKTKLYWGRYYPIQVLEDDGEVYTYEDYHNVMLGSKRRRSIWKKIKDFFAVDVAYYILDKPKSFWYWMTDIVFLLKNKIERKAIWSFDYYMIREIEKVLPRLMANKIGISPKYLDMAIMKLHEGEEGFDLKKYNEEHCSSGYPKEVEKLANEIMKNTYNEIILHCKLYRYYSGFGNLDFDDKDAKEFDKEWRHTLPIIEGSYDEFDNKKLQKLQDDEWHAIWRMMDSEGQTMWD